MDGWSKGEDFTQVEHDVEVKILLWVSADYPTPDVLIDWTDVRTGGRPTVATTTVGSDMRGGDALRMCISFIAAPRLIRV